MDRYYFRHCGSYHPVSPDTIFDENGEIYSHTPLVVCPTCRRPCWLTHVVDMESDDSPDDETPDTE